ncbi:MAG TPA: glycosyl hydrolase 108 family protein [Candidatus Limnocylindrales bacterium]|nr:glycosyl hydrolase 108 family protein [Candidatus Limnocylindrales bacterium]
MNFLDSFARLIGNEGEFDDDSTDRGNWTGGRIGVGTLKGTKYGISAAAFPDLDIKSVTLDQARAIYMRRYWGPAGCDLVPEALKFPLFDFAVNSGPGKAARMLQRAVGAIEDGSIGPKTLMSIQSMPIDKVLRRFDAHRNLHFTDDPAWPTYGRGWIRRVALNALEAS